MQKRFFARPRSRTSSTTGSCSAPRRVPVARIVKQPSGRWQARYYDHAKKQHALRFDRKIDAQRWLDEQTSALVTGTHVDPRTARQTVDQWCDTWLAGY